MLRKYCHTRIPKIRINIVKGVCINSLSLTAVSILEKLEDYFKKGTVNIFRLLNTVTPIQHLHSIYIENIMDTLHIVRYGNFMNALHNFYIYSETIRNKQTNDKSTLQYNTTFDVIVQHEIGTGQPYPYYMSVDMSNSAGCKLPVDTNQGHHKSMSTA